MVGRVLAIANLGAARSTSRCPLQSTGGQRGAGERRDAVTARQQGEDPSDLGCGVARRWTRLSIATTTTAKMRPREERRRVAGDISAGSPVGCQNPRAVTWLYGGWRPSRDRLGGHSRKRRANLNALTRKGPLARLSNAQVTGSGRIGTPHPRDKDRCDVTDSRAQQPRSILPASGRPSSRVRTCTSTGSGLRRTGSTSPQCWVVGVSSSPRSGRRQVDARAETTQGTPRRWLKVSACFIRCRYRGWPAAGTCLRHRRSPTPSPPGRQRRRHAGNLRTKLRDIILERTRAVMPRLWMRPGEVFVSPPPVQDKQSVARTSTR